MDTDQDQPQQHGETASLPHITEDGLLEVVLGMALIALGLALFEQHWLMLATSPVWLLAVSLLVVPLVRRFFITPRLQEWWHAIPHEPKDARWLLIFDGLAVLLVVAPVAYALLAYRPFGEALRWLSRWSPLCLGGALLFELVGLSFRWRCKRWRFLGVVAPLIGISATLYEAQHRLQPLAVLAMGMGFATLLVGVMVWGLFIQRHPLPWQR